MIIIIRASLVGPPTTFSSFRDLTLFINMKYRDDILLEAENPDFHYHWIKSRGGMDFVQDFIRPGEEAGIRIDVPKRYPLTIVTDRITQHNIINLMGKIALLR